jgi:hypothetical protein
VNGYFQVSAVLLPIKSVKLSGYQDRKGHLLQWEIESQEKIRETSIEASFDGNSFKLLHTMTSEVGQFTHVPSKNGIHYYRIRVTSESGETKYSNIVKLAHLKEARVKYTVQNMMPNELIIVAENKFEYRLFDFSGVAVSSGTGVAGTNRVNLAALPTGIYMVRLSAPEGTETKRFIKQ